MDLEKALHIISTQDAILRANEHPHRKRAINPFRPWNLVRGLGYGLVTPGVALTTVLTIPAWAYLQLESFHTGLNPQDSGDVMMSLFATLAFIVAAIPVPLLAVVFTGKAINYLFTEFEPIAGRIAADTKRRKDALEAEYQDAKKSYWETKKTADRELGKALAGTGLTYASWRQGVKLIPDKSSPAVVGASQEQAR